MTPERIKAFRKDNDLSQAELAARLGLNQATISRAENGDPLPKSAELLLEMMMEREPAPASPEGAAA